MSGWSRQPMDDDDHRERAYISAARRSLNRSISDRVISALEASRHHFHRTGRAFYITEQIVADGRTFEELDDEEQFNDPHLLYPYGLDPAVVRAAHEAEIQRNLEAAASVNQGNDFNRHPQESSFNQGFQFEGNPFMGQPGPSVMVGPSSNSTMNIGLASGPTPTGPNGMRPGHMACIPPHLNMHLPTHNFLDNNPFGHTNNSLFSSIGDPGNPLNARPLFADRHHPDCTATRSNTAPQGPSFNNPTVNHDAGIEQSPYSYYEYENLFNDSLTRPFEPFDIGDLIRFPAENEEVYMGEEPTERNEPTTEDELAEEVQSWDATPEYDAKTGQHQNFKGKGKD